MSKKSLQWYNKHRMTVGQKTWCQTHTATHKIHWFVLCLTIASGSQAACHGYTKGTEAPYCITIINKSSVTLYGATCANKIQSILTGQTGGATSSPGCKTILIKGLHSVRKERNVDIQLIQNKTDYTIKCNGHTDNWTCKEKK